VAGNRGGSTEERTSDETPSTDCDTQKGATLEPEAAGPTDEVAGSGLQRDPARLPAAVPASWLTPFDGTREDVDLDAAVRALRRRERLAEDADLVDWLRQFGFAGRDYERFATELARYGHAVTMAWIRKGAIFGKCRERGIGLPEPPPGALQQGDVAEGLANETIALALRSFRENVLLPGRWNPARGASLKTFFIGQCLFRFPNVYRAWRNTETDLARHERLSYDPRDELAVFDRPAHGGLAPDPADLAAMRQEVDILMGDAPERVKTMLALIAVGWTQADVGNMLNLSENTVQKAVSKYRSKVISGKPTNDRQDPTRTRKGA
jgi:DNA-directed RNA polymerase specialized sigma24 family protein